LRIVGVLSAMGRGKAALKAEIAAKTEIDVSHLPYDEEDEYRLHICYTANINICVGPSIVDGSGWIEMMPRAHNGYLDVRLETGLIGFALFVASLSQPSTRLGARQTATPFGHGSGSHLLSLLSSTTSLKPCGCAA